ncbi:alpha/beta hydrolase [Faecalispora anaeroviscerum]|uniref:alpha/beta hydrolase n=1 Tax=Faecalispora anaeroviscerum TaxID=2991836 RepID=UPI0024BA58DA|nr:alpha/beta hydrolase [Faecalispora anaeroviscerum]
MIKTQKLQIEHIPSIVWGEPAERVFLAVHGNLSHKEDTVIQLLAEEAALRGVQVISFDLPEHGERTGEGTPCKVQFCVRDLRKVMDYAKSRWSQINLFACSMGAYFSLLEYQTEPLKQALFLSPVVDMQRIIENMMTWFEVSEEKLKDLGQVQTPIGQTLYWDYYCYVKENPIEHWGCETSILYGANDTLCERDTINAFTQRFGCRLDVLNNGEHFFHTPEQLSAFAAWLRQNLH